MLLLLFLLSCSDSNDPKDQETYKGEKMSLISSNCNIYTQGTEPSEKISIYNGGAMSMLPYVACIMTKDPILCMGDSRSGQIIEYHYEADFNGDGTYGDTYADKYNFFLLTSDASFSCGSSLPAMLKGTNVKIIGKDGAGGDCPVTTFTDGSGIIYQTSGYMGVYYKDGDKYISIENGVPVDYELEESEWYDYENLTEKLIIWFKNKQNS